MATEIVAADDDRTIREVLEYELSTAGYDVTTFENGRTVWEHLSSTSEPPDLLILDVMMPGLDGVRVLENVRADGELGDLPVIVLTSRGREDDVVEGFESGATDYVTKPFRPQELRSRIERALEG